MTGKEIREILDKIKSLEYPLRYWAFEEFIHEFPEEAEYFMYVCKNVADDYNKQLHN